MSGNSNGKSHMVGFLRISLVDCFFSYFPQAQNRTNKALHALLAKAIEKK